MLLVQSIFHEEAEVSETSIEWAKPEGLNFGGNYV